MKLASVQKVLEVRPIDGADAIEMVIVLGWQVVVKKGEYNVGDLCCYIQIDTIVPEREEFEFLRERKFRVKTIKLRKQISQGLIIPLPDGKWREGDDLTEIVGVKKFEKVDTNPVFVKPRMPKVWYKKWIYLLKYNVWYKMFPSSLPKERTKFPTELISITDEERIQNIPNVLLSHRGKEFYLSYKLDGSSITIIHNRVMGKSKFRICSRRFELHDKNNDWHKVFTETSFDTHILELVRHFGTNDIIVQGEAIGKFNGNHHNLSTEEIRLFNIQVNGKRVPPSQFIRVCLELNIPHCPLHSIVIMNHTMDEALEMSKIPDILNPKVDVEGLVWRCGDGTLSFKAINNNYLMKEK